MIDSIKFDTTNNIIVVTYADGTSTTYTHVMCDQYLLDFPDRAADLKAMGWA